MWNSLLNRNVKIFNIWRFSFKTSLTKEVKALFYETPTPVTNRGDPKAI